MNYLNSAKIKSHGKNSLLLLFSVCERAEFSTEFCNLIGSRSGRFFTILPAKPRAINVMASFTGLFWVNEHFPLKITLL